MFKHLIFYPLEFSLIMVYSSRALLCFFAIDFKQYMELYEFQIPLTFYNFSALFKEQYYNNDVTCCDQVH